MLGIWRLFVGTMSIIMNLAKWEKHHWGSAVIILIGLVAASFYWGQSSVVDAAPKNKTDFTIGQRIATNINLSVYDKAHATSAGVQCVQPAGAMGTIADGPKNGQGATWLNVTFDSYCSGWVAVDGVVSAI